MVLIVDLLVHARPPGASGLRPFKLPPSRHLRPTTSTRRSVASPGPSAIGRALARARLQVAAVPAPPAGAAPGPLPVAWAILRLPVGPGLACGASQPRPGASGGLLQARAPDPTGGASASASSHRHMMGRKSGERARIVRSSPEMTMSEGRSPKHGLAADPNPQCSSRGDSDLSDCGGGGGGDDD